MKKDDLEKMIRESVIELINEELVDLDWLHNKVSPNTLIGASWHQLIVSLESVYNHVKDFQELYLTQPNKPETAIAKQKLDQVIKLLEETYLTIQSISQVQKKDQL